MQLHLSRTEAAVFQQTKIGLTGRNGACAAAYGLEVCIRYPADLHSGREHGRTHAVATGHILGTALVNEHP